MLLHDIGKSPDATFRRINQHLETNYGFKISEDVSDKDLVAIMEQIEEEITELKIKGDDARGSSEISKRLLVLEGVKNLREFAMMQFQSPKLDTVVSNLTDYVVDTFEISGMQQADFDRAVNRAMEEYRSSRYRFPDDIIEHRVRQEAIAKIHADSAIKNAQGGLGSPAPMMEDEQTDEADEAQGDSEMKGIDETEGGRERGLEYSQDWKADPKKPHNQQSTKGVPMVRDKRGNMVPDPFAAHAAERRKGIAMKEHANLVKNLRRLLETEVSQAEVMMAAKGFAQELQEMVEKIGRLQNEDLPPVTDQMRETYGMESASAFQTQIYGALQMIMDSLYTAKTQVDDAVGNMASTGQVSAETDMDKDVGLDGMDDMDMGDETAMDAEPEDLDNIGAELDAEPADEFGGEEALGREMKTESLQRKVMEMKKLVAKAKKLKESRK